MIKLLKILFIILLSTNGLISCANDVLPQNYTPNNINPYKESWFKLVKAENPFNKIQPEFYHPEKMQNPFSQEESKYNNVLSRMEREWLNKEYTNQNDEERISRLEEKIFGTIHDGNLKNRCNQLRKAFDARKNIQAKHRNYTHGMFSGLPTSTPMNIDGLVEN
ncbi:MAG: hypothetical protein NC200_00035 [Candidatus Gastranaerophilales bacterium]|nr:hypothetical protein [Candidatus Gastranaerophilales bacterium]